MLTAPVSSLASNHAFVIALLCRPSQEHEMNILEISDSTEGSLANVKFSGGKEVTVGDGQTMAVFVAQDDVDSPRSSRMEISLTQVAIVLLLTALPTASLEQRVSRMKVCQFRPCAFLTSIITDTGDSRAGENVSCGVAHVINIL